MLRHKLNKHDREDKNYAYHWCAQSYPPPPQGVTPPPPPTPEEATPPQPPPPQGAPTPPPLLQGAPQTRSSATDVMFHHPFTMVVSGPTACGKTMFVKSVLQHHEKRIKPTVDRIVWLCKRWQPLYKDFQNHVLPRVEFIQGIHI